MLLKDFDFDLPPELIAAEPAEPRDRSRLLVVDKKTGSMTHAIFSELPGFLNEQDLLVRNNTRVIPARLFTTTERGSKIEVFLLEPLENGTQRWHCLVKPGKKVKEGLTLQLRDGSLASVVSGGERFVVTLPNKEDFFAWLDRVGVPPLPPYIKRKATDKDRSRYQTVYARTPGSVAAPTAGLHFTPAVFSALAERKIESTDLTLHVGYGTFSPMRCEHISEHRMHAEFYEIPEKTTALLEKAKAQGNRRVAVGTTSLRALESYETRGRQGQTDIFITPGYEFRQADALITNFHLPQSSLFILVCAFLGTDLAKAVYAEAIAQKYRFYSYGDAMLLL